MRRYFVGLLFLLMLAGTAYGQSTTVSGTITDSGGQTWNAGTYQAVFVPNAASPGGPYNWNGSTFNTNTTYSGSLSSGGAFTQSLPSNT